MKVNGLLKFLVFGTASTALMGVVFRSNANQALANPFFKSSKSVVLPIDTPPTKEPVKLPYRFKDNNGRQPQFDDKSKLYLDNPSNVKTNTEYDPKTNSYNVQQKIGDTRYRPDTYIDFEDYQDYMFHKAVHDHWRTRIKAEDVNAPRKGIVPKLQINNELFDRIFGGNTVDIRPTGTVELIFGLNRNKTLNPAIPQRQQKVTNFDFNMRIQLNLIGKIGDKLKITTNYNTEASFDWENQIKLDYTGYEDEIIKKIEAGNVTLPLNSQLITGSQSLFGIKTQLQFGKLTATTILSQQRGKKQEVTVQGGAQTQYFNIPADSYETNKHYFLGQYFRDNYDYWMSSLPVMNTPVVITKVEVYILNQTGNQEQTRTLLAFEDLGEDSSHVHPYLKKSGNTCMVPLTYAVEDSAGFIPSNGANNLYYNIADPTAGILKARDAASAPALLTGVMSGSNICTGSGYMVQGRDFDKIMNARKLNSTEFTLNNRLGYISLNQTLNNDQVLAVSYQLTYNGRTYQVGEFSDQIPDNTKALFCKLLKPATVNVRYPTWDLMMKNVYSIGAYNLNAQDFKLDITYNNIETGVDIPYLPFGAVNGKQLIQVMDLDKLSVNGDKYSDGIFDFLPGFTINPANGRIYFKTIEPFASTIKSKFDVVNDFPNANKYVFQELYDSTRVSAQQLPEKNRYKIKGSYKSASGSEISLNALNIPQGAVVVTANGVRLGENTDYTVDYTLGRVKIINEGILNSGAQIKVSVESNSLFNIQQKSLMGTRLDYKVNRDLTLGGTFLRFAEKPVTQKVSTGDEPVSNIVWGTDYNYKTDAPFLTRLIDKIPLIDTKEMSSITTSGEFAQLIPGNAAAIGKNGNSYVDDFEGSVSVIDVRNPQSWFMASIPQGQPSLFPEGSFTDDIITGKNRARFNWYTIDPSLTRTQGQGITPSYYNKNIYSNNLYRQVLETELFPGKTPPNGQPVVLPVLDMGFYPTERGPYNMDVDPTPQSSGIDKNTGRLNNPQSRWGGIMRRLETNDFQAANIEYIQFWMMDPFNDDYNNTTHPDMDANNTPSGDMYINLGNISEDIIKDGRMSYENGIPGQSAASASNPTVSTNVAVVPTLPPITNAFAADVNDRPYQDVGYDGMNNDQEKTRFSSIINTTGINGAAKLNQQFLNDPSSDDYHFFRGDDYDANLDSTLTRYSRYNNPEGNSPTEEQYKSQNGAGYSTSASNIPNIEDINKDNTLSETENYYQYHVKISKQDLNLVGSNFIVDQFERTAEVEGVTKKVKWYQFKIPITQFESTVGGIEGFNSIRFMRVFMKGFAKPVVVRLARFEMVRSDWRRYLFDLTKPGEYIATDDNTTSFDVSGVSVQENGQKTPVNYVIPPGIQQQQNIQTTNLVLQNEQALQLRTCNLKDGDSRAIYKNVDLDTRMFKHLKMFVHAEELNKQKLNNGEMTMFVRLGTDFNNNFYEYEVPLQLTNPGYYDPNSDDDKYIVWPTTNEVDINFEDLTTAKEARNKTTGKDLSSNQTPYQYVLGTTTINVVGSPNLGTLKSIMIGIRNPKDNGALPHCVEVWVNELRLTDFNNKGGWATTGRVQAKLADLGQVSLAATYSKPFFGSVEKKINERSKETTLNWDFASSVQMGKFFPAKWKVSLPIYYSYGETRVSPLFNPYEPDVLLSGIHADPSNPEGLTAEDVRNIKYNSLDYTKRRGYNLTNVRIDGLKKKGAKPMPWDISNFSFTYAYTELFKRNVNIDHSLTKQYRGNAAYRFAMQPKSWKPFSKMKIFENKWWTIIRDFNLQPLPNSFGVSTDITRNYSELLNRDITSFYNNDFNKTLVQYNKQFLITRNWDFRWDFTKALKFDYTANNDGRVLEPFGALDTKEKKDTVRNNLKSFGENINFRQQFNVNYSLPINKIPILDFVNIQTRYSGSYTWTRRPFAAADSIGNVIQNTNSQNYTGNFNMTSLYNKIPYFRKINSGIPTGGRNNSKTDSNDNTSLDSTKTKKKSVKSNQGVTDIFEFLARGIMMVKNISLSLTKTNGTAMPNFKPTSRYVGMDWGNNMAPGLPFILGSQDTSIRNISADRGWLARNLVQTQPFTQTQTKNFTYRASLEPHGSLKVELNGNLNQSKNYSAYMRYDTNGTYLGKSPIYRFNESPNETGNFSISAFTLGRSFKDKGKGVESQLFTDFLATRQDYGRLLSQDNPNSAGSKQYTTLSGANKNYFDGYNETQQDVLIGSFYEAYTGKKQKNYNTKNIFPSIPMPNWTVSWDGLGKLKVFKKVFRSITIRHGYRSTYTIGGYNNNLLYGTDGNGNTATRSPIENPIIGATQLSQNFNPKYSVTSVVLSEQFAPLIKFDFQFVKPGWQGNFEIKKDKTVTLNLTGPQIIETKGHEVVVGAGYRYPKLTLKKVKIQGKPLQSDLNVKLDISYRQNATIIRRIVDEISTPTGGTDIISLRSSVDYQLTPQINLRFFYDWVKTIPKTTASFPTSNTNGGFSIRINLQ